MRFQTKQSTIKNQTIMRVEFESGEYLNVTATLIKSGVPFPNEPKGKGGEHNEFMCTISNPSNGRKMMVAWYGSQADYMTGKKELDEGMARSILSSVALDASCYSSSRHFEDFCASLGYSDDSIRALKIYKACKSEYECWEKVSSGLSEETIEEIYNY